MHHPTHRPRVNLNMLKTARRQNRLLCLGYEDTQECKNSKTRLKELEERYDEQCRIDESSIEFREYDT